MTVTFPHVRGLTPDMYAVGPAESQRASQMQEGSGQMSASGHVRGLTPGMAKGDA